MVDSDHICAHILHLLCISLALFGIDERISGDELVGNAFDVELVAVGREEFGADGRDNGGGSESVVESCGKGQ